MDKHEFHDLAFSEQGDKENFGDTIERIYARVVAERDAARADADKLRDELATLRLVVQGAWEKRPCAICGREPDRMNMNTVVLCDNCYEDRIA